jgi:hypothetical protein
MSPVFWAAVLTMFKPGVPGETKSTLMGTHYTNEAACTASTLRNQPAGPVHTPDGRWIIYSCAKVDPESYFDTDDGEHDVLKPGINRQKLQKSICDAAREAGDALLVQKCSESKP